MAKCKYYANNGKPSQLFDRLYSYYSSKGMTPMNAELAAVTSWLATRTDKFKDFAGDTVTDNTNPKTVVLDSNGEPEMVYFGESSFFSDLPTEDYRSMFSSPMLFNFTAGVPKDVNFRYPFFVSIKNPKIINVDADFTKDQMALATQGVDKSEYDGVVFIHTKENGDQEKMYSVLSTEVIQEVYNNYDRKINTTFDTSTNRVRLETIQSNELMSEPVINFTAGIKHSNRFLEVALRGDDADMAKMARSVLLAKDKAIPIEEGGGKMIGYNEEKGVLTVDPALNLSRGVFNNIMFAETLRAHMLKAYNAADMAGLENIIETGLSRLPASDYSKYFKDANTFINAVFNDINFINYLKDTRFPGASETLYDSVLKIIGQQFNFRESYLPMFDNAIQQGIYSRRPEEVGLFNSDLEDNMEEEEAEEEGAIKETPVQAPYSHLVTGDTLLDRHIKDIFDKLQAVKQRFNKVGKGVDVTRMRAQIFQYQADLDKITQSRAAEILVEIGKAEMDRLEKALDEDIGYKEAWENLSLLEGWKMFYNNLDRSGDGDPVMLKAAREISSTANILYNDYKEVAWDGTVSALTSEGIPTKYIKDLTPGKVINDVSGGQAMFEGLSFGQTGLEIAGDYLIHNRAFKINNAFNAFELKQKQLLEKLGSKDISFMFKKDADGNYRPITTYKTELYEMINKLTDEQWEQRADLKPLYKEIRDLNEKHAEAKASGDKLALVIIESQRNDLYKEIAEQKKMNSTRSNLNEFMRTNFDYVLTQEGLDEFAEFAEVYKDQFYNLNSVTGEMEFNERAYNEAIKRHDPNALMEWVKDNSNPYPQYAAKYTAVTPKDKWKSSEYDNMTDVQKEFYDFFIDEFKKAQTNVPMDYSFTDYDADQLLREFAYMEKKTLDKFSRLGKEVRNWAADIVSVEYREQDVSFDVKGPVSGKMVKKLKFKKPASFAKGTGGYWKESDKDELSEGYKKGLEQGNFKWKDGYLVVASKGTQFEKMVRRTVDLEDDPLVIFNNFIKFGLSYKYKREVEDVLNSLVEMAADTEKQPYNKKGIINAMGQALGSKVGSNLDQRLNYTIDAFLHGDVKDRPDIKEGAVPGERTFSIRQVIENMNNLTRARQLGLNITSGISNLSMGTINNFTYAGRDEFFSEKELKHAYWILKDSIASLYSGGTRNVGDSQKIMLLMQQFNMLGSLHDQFNLDNEHLNKLFEHLYIFQKGGEYLNQGAVAIAMMLREKVKDENGQEVSLWDAYEVKDGKLNYKLGDKTKYADQNKVFIFAEATKKIIKEIHGDYDPLNPMMAKRQLRWRIGMLFRTWLPQAIKQRVGGKYRDYQLSMLKGVDVYREGRWNTFGRTMNIFSNSAKDVAAGITRLDKAKNILTFIGAIAANTIHARAGRRVIDNLGLEGADKANMYANVKEAWWLMIISVASMLLMKLKSGDDEDKDGEDAVQSSILFWIINQTNRVENELWFFNSPSSFSTIFRDAIPLWSTLEQGQKVINAAKRYILDNEKDTYVRGFRKGDSKLATQLQLFFPVSKQGQNLWSMWSQIYTDKNK